MIESLESRRLFAATLPAARVVIPLTPAADAAGGHTPSVDMPAAADNGAEHVADALDHIPDIGD
jgi:hypothetical protein